MRHRIDNVRKIYFDWMCDKVSDQPYFRNTSYEVLLKALHQTDFTYTIPLDENRAQDGMDLRWRFANEVDFGMPPEQVMDHLEAPCSVLEMMIALSIRCEEHLMDDPDIGDRTGQWFWMMIMNLGLNRLTDERFDYGLFHHRIMIFLNREYHPNGTGGLFVVDGCSQDMRKLEIWYQMALYLRSIMYGGLNQ